MCRSHAVLVRGASGMIETGGSCRMRRMRRMGGIYAFHEPNGVIRTHVGR